MVCHLGNFKTWIYLYLEENFEVYHFDYQGEILGLKSMAGEGL